ncbi:hypothetical protein O0L34_g2251 [Tuta absoluta]|nr:hypothetical protein O0L34_g2251 [Tuta absoluta]
MANKACVVCNAKSVTKSTGRTCDTPTCKKSYHFKCIGLTDVQIEKLKLATFAWSCPRCAINESLRNARARSGSTSPPPTPSPSKGSTPIKIKKVDSIASLQQSVQRLIDSNEEILRRLSAIEKLTPDVKGLHKRVEDLERDCKQDRLRITELEERIDSIEEQRRGSSVEVQGVPYSENEDLFSHMEKLGKKVGVPLTPNDISQCYRIKVTNAAASSKAKVQHRIIARFVHKHKRDQFLKQSRTKKGNKSLLTTEILDLPGTPTSIYVNEHLSGAKRNILSKTKEHFKNKLKFSFVWVQDGKILLRKNEQSSILTIKNNGDFLKLVSKFSVE